MNKLIMDDLDKAIRNLDAAHQADYFHDLKQADRRVRLAQAYYNRYQQQNSTNYAAGHRQQAPVPVNSLQSSMPTVPQIQPLHSGQTDPNAVPNYAVPRVQPMAMPVKQYTDNPANNIQDNVTPMFNRSNPAQNSYNNPNYGYSTQPQSMTPDQQRLNRMGINPNQMQQMIQQQNSPNNSENQMPHQQDIEQSLSGGQNWIDVRADRNFIQQAFQYWPQLISQIQQIQTTQMQQGVLSPDEYNQLVELTRQKGWIAARISQEFDPKYLASRK